MRQRVLTEVQGEKIVSLESAAAQGNQGAFYLSSGVHGDEPGAAWGLLAWAESNFVRLRQEAFLIFPCLNPWGLMANTRADHRGLDINRRFHIEDDEICGPWRLALAGRRCRLGLCLHEDYDAQGCYIYELSHLQRPAGHAILEKCARVIPPDPRRKIDGRSTQGGVIRRRTPPADLPGMPEAIVLHQLGCPMTLTFETPSEFSLDERVQTQADFITAALSYAPSLEDAAP